MNSSAEDEYLENNGKKCELIASLSTDIQVRLPVICAAASWTKAHDELLNIVRQITRYGIASQLDPLVLLARAVELSFVAIEGATSLSEVDIDHLNIGLHRLLKKLESAASSGVQLSHRPPELICTQSGSIDQSIQNLGLEYHLLGERAYELFAFNCHAIVSIADARGIITYANEKFCDISGYQPDELVGQTHRLIKSDWHPRSFYQEMWRAISSGEVWKGDICNRRKNGDLYWVASTIVPFIGENSRPNHYVSIRTDITKTKELQLESRRSSQAKSEFLSNMSHELRTPMNSILGFAQILEFDDVLDEEQLDSVKEISIAGRHLLELINDVLDLSKIESGHVVLTPESIQISDLLAECIDLVLPDALQHGIKLQHLEVVNYSVMADRVRLKQVLLNLLSNAVKYNREEGSVTLCILPMDEKTLRVTVADTGPGISLEQQEQLFKPFNRLGAENSKIEGTGLGLSIAQRLVEMMGGRIGVDSEQGAGSWFWLEVPRASVPPQTQEVNDVIDTVDVVDSSLQTTYRVLYIEDNPANLKLVRQILVKHPHIELTTAQEPELGLEVAAELLPELILLDINMPRLNGYQVLKKLREDPRFKDTPVVAITARAMQGDIAQGKGAGFTEYMTKPLDVKAFMLMVDSLLIEN